MRPVLIFSRVFQLVLFGERVARENVSEIQFKSMRSPVADQAKDIPVWLVHWHQLRPAIRWQTQKVKTEVGLHVPSLNSVHSFQRKRVTSLGSSTVTYLRCHWHLERKWLAYSWYVQYVVKIQTVPLREPALSTSLWKNCDGIGWECNKITSIYLEFICYNRVIQ